MSKMYSTANLSDKELKEQGNRLFSLHKYEDAANCYTKAIVSDVDRYMWLCVFQIRPPISVHICVYLLVAQQDIFCFEPWIMRSAKDDNSSVPLAPEIRTKNNNESEWEI